MFGSRCWPREARAPVDRDRMVDGGEGLVYIGGGNSGMEFSMGSKWASKRRMRIGHSLFNSLASFPELFINITSELLKKLINF
jgi:hypothetical protein